MHKTDKMNKLHKLHKLHKLNSVRSPYVSKGPAYLSLYVQPFTAPPLPSPSGKAMLFRRERQNTSAA